MSQDAQSSALATFRRRVEAARAGTNPAVIAKLASGWLVMGDWQFLPGYCLLLADPMAEHLNALDRSQRVRFLDDMALAGDALLEVTGALRINYQILGNVCPALHAHICPRYAWEPPDKLRGSTAIYFQGSGPTFDAQRDREFMARFAAAIERRR